MHERSRAQRVVGSLTAQLPPGNPAQLCIHERKQVIHGNTSPQSYGVLLQRLNVFPMYLCGASVNEPIRQRLRLLLNIG